ncbi:general substrate transporter [Penicillium malachiteum]|nr:general substrate transporter [Penicillium malachiteum]
MEKVKEENEHWEEGQTTPGEVDKNLNEIQGRAIQQQEHNRGYWETLNNDPWLLFWIGVMLWTLIIRGFENQSAGSVISIAEFKRRFGQQESDGTYFIATSWQSALSGGGNAAAILGAWGSSYLADIFGTKPVLIAGCAINIASVGVEFATTSIGMFFGGKMMNFVAIGVFLNLCTAYVSDISPLAIRASVIGFCNLSQCIGPFISAIMSYYTSQWDTDWSWKALVCAQWGFAIIGFVGQLFMPESPVYLVRVNKVEDARKVLNRLYSKPADAEGHLQRIKLTLEEAETQKRATYAECFRGTNLRRTMIAVLVFLAEPMSGLGFVQNYGSLMYQFLGIGDRESFLIQIGAQILSISGATLSFLIGDFYGRRPMFLGGCISLTILLLCMGIAGSVNTTAGITAAVGFYTMYNFVFNIGVGSNVYAIAGEVPTSVLRTKTLAISLIVSNAVNTMWSFVAPYMFNPGYGDLKAKIGFVFGGFMLFFIAGAWYLVPETRMRTYEELDELFMNRVPTREFKKYVTVAERRAAEAYTTERKLSTHEVEREV